VKKQTSTPQQRVLRKKIRKLTGGVSDALINVVLYGFYVGVSIEGGRGPFGIHRGFEKADELLAQLDGKKVRKALSNLRQKGLIKTIKGQVLLSKITEAGFSRINSLFPEYDAKRIWDGRIYIVNYDIPREHNKGRDKLRYNLNRLKARRLQDSVYLTPFNPRDVIEEIVNEYNIYGQILVSTLDPKDAFGNIDIKELLWDIYNMSRVNYGYEEFIRKYKHIDKKSVGRLRTKIAFGYISALEADPQLPFELLPDKYLGDEANILFRELLRRSTLIK
jgi:CRISPR-associated endonuclease Cas2